MTRFEPTPVITGKDAERFWEEMNRERTPEEIGRIKKTVEIIKKIFDRHGKPKNIPTGKFQFLRMAKEN